SPLDHVLDALHGLANGLGRFLHGLLDLVLQGLQLVLQRRPRLVHLLADGFLFGAYFGLVIHCTFSLRASADCSGSGLTLSSLRLPARYRQAPATTKSAATMPKHAHSGRWGSNRNSSRYTSVRLSRIPPISARPAPAPSSSLASRTLR